jgi:WXG100 family type VII secretion target
MPAPRIRGDYDSLAQISQIFARHAENMQRSIQQVQRQIDTLQGGDWVGKGATAFYQEMDGEVLPALKRLATGFSTANRVARQISQILNQAEEEAARILVVVGTGGVGVSVGRAIGAAVEQASWQEANPLLARDPNSLFTNEKLHSLIGSQFQGTGSELGEVMNGLMQNPVGDKLDQFIQTLASLRDRPVIEIQVEYERFQEISEQRDAMNTDTPTDTQAEMSGGGGGQSSFTGSDTQMRYGSVVGDAFDIDPAFGSMLNPSGGLMGPGNWAIAGANTAVGYHSVVHDAAGYLHKYHQIGPGYDYLGQEGGDPSNPLSGQRSGIKFWRQATGGSSSTSTSAGFAASGAVGGKKLGSKLTEDEANLY